MKLSVIPPEPDANPLADPAAALEIGTELLRGGRLFLAIAVLASAWLLSVGARKALQFAWRAGADPERRLSVLKLGFDLALVTAVTWLGLQEVASIAPGSSTLAVALLCLFAVAALFPELQNLVAGVSIRASEQLRGRDLVSMGEIEAEVLRLGLTHIEMRVDDGSVVFVPNRTFRDQVVKVERKRKVWPIAVRLSGSFSLDEIERLKIAAIMCPYRSQHTQVTVQQRLNTRSGSDGIVVKLSCWSKAGTEQAIHYVEQMASSTVGSKLSLS